jgi:hypothetical protein
MVTSTSGPTRGRPTIVPMPTLAFDPSRYPRTYKASLLVRGALLVFGGLFLLAGLAMLLIACQRDLADGPSGTALRAVVTGLVLVGVGAVSLLAFVRGRVVLTPDAIEIRRLWSTRHVLRADIADFRRVPHAYGATVYRIRTAVPKRTLVIPHASTIDADFVNWFAGLPNADIIEYARERAAIAVDDRLGATPALRLAAADRAIRASRWMSSVATLMVIWTLAYPTPRGLLLALDAALVPAVIALCALSNGLFAMDGKKNSGRAQLLPVLMASVVALGFRAWWDVKLVSYWPLVVPSVAIGLLVAIAAWIACRHSARTPGHPLFNWIVFALWAAGGLTLANGEFDRGPRVSQVVTVVKARKTSGRHADTYFTLSQVPADVDSTEVQVPLYLYQRLKVGDPACITERDGAFGWHWIVVTTAGWCQAR